MHLVLGGGRAGTVGRMRKNNEKKIEMACGELIINRGECR